MNSFNDLIIEQNKNLTPEYILKWLEQSNQFVRAFLTPADIEKWRKVKSQIDKKTTSFDD